MWLLSVSLDVCMTAVIKTIWVFQSIYICNDYTVIEIFQQFCAWSYCIYRGTVEILFCFEPSMWRPGQDGSLQFSNSLVRLAMVKIFFSFFFLLSQKSSRRGSLLKKKKTQENNVRMKTLGIKNVDDTFRVWFLVWLSEVFQIIYFSVFACWLPFSLSVIIH